MPSGLPITNPNPKSGETQVNIYGYTPWLGLGIVAVILFAICLLAHATYGIQAFLASRHQRKNPEKIIKAQTRLPSKIVTFEILVCVGCLLEVIGYGFRSASSTNPYVLVFFVLNYFMIVVVSGISMGFEYYPRLFSRDADIASLCTGPCVLFGSVVLHFDCCSAPAAFT